MQTNTHSPQASQMIITLEEGASASDIRKTLLMIRGIVSVRYGDDRHTITPALRSKIRKARAESANGETIVCHSPEAMQQYFDSL